MKKISKLVQTTLDRSQWRERWNAGPPKGPPVDIHAQCRQDRREKIWRYIRYYLVLLLLFYLLCKVSQC